MPGCVVDAWHFCYAISCGFAYHCKPIIILVNFICSPYQSKSLPISSQRAVMLFWDWASVILNCSGMPQLLGERDKSCKLHTRSAIWETNHNCIKGCNLVRTYLGVRFAEPSETYSWLDMPRLRWQRCCCIVALVCKDSLAWIRKWAQWTTQLCQLCPISGACIKNLRALEPWEQISKGSEPGILSHLPRNLHKEVLLKTRNRGY